MGVSKLSAAIKIQARFQSGIAGSKPALNSNVLNILPISTLRIIDLEGKKNSSPLFSRFCSKTQRFFWRFTAPKYVQSGRGGG
jgi:hypothetical protein